MNRASVLACICLVAASAAALSACTRRGGPAPLDDRSNLYFGRGTAVPVARPASERPPTSRAAAIFTNPGAVTVQSGDTLYGISKRTNVPIRAIINANNLRPPYVLQIGQPLILPRQAYHEVVSGDLVASIARAYGLSSQELVRLNGIEPPYVIYVGQPVLLPTMSDGRTVATGAAVASATRQPPAQPQASTSRGGEAVVTSVSPGTREPPSTIEAAPTRPMPQLTPSQETTVASLPPAEAVPAVPAAPPPPEAPVLAPTGAFIWPVQGNVISGYGPKQGGLYNEGINIAVPRGTPVRAAQDGEVAYVGNELRGYGNLLLLRHPNGWVTAYAHNDTLLVQRGDKIRRGQVIARSGATGSVDTPQLHFELRQGTRSVDPARHLSGQGVSDNGNRRAG